MTAYIIESGDQFTTWVRCNSPSMHARKPLRNFRTVPIGGRHQKLLSASLNFPLSESYSVYGTIQDEIKLDFLSFIFLHLTKLFNILNFFDMIFRLLDHSRLNIFNLSVTIAILDYRDKRKINVIK